MTLLFSVIAAIFFFVELTIAGENNTCGMQCTDLSNAPETYTGRTSILFHCGDYTEVSYSVKLKVYSVITVKYNIAIVTNGKFLVVFNIRTGVYIVLDHNTNLCIYGNTHITFLTATNNVDHDKLITQSNDILKVYTSITAATKDSFDFQLIINAFFISKNFKIESIYSSKELTTVLRKNFDGWFALIETQIKAGNIFIRYSYWGFLAVIIDHEIHVALFISEFLRISVNRYHAIETDLIVYLTNAATREYAAFQNAVSKLTALSVILEDVDIATLIGYLDDPQYDATVYQITVKNIRYAIAVYKVKHSFAIRLTILINNVYIQHSIYHINGILGILNAQTNIGLALQGTSALVLNKTSASVFVVDFSNTLNASITVCNNATFTALAIDEEGIEVHKQIHTYIKENSLSGHRCNLQTLIKAVINHDVKSVSDVVGSAELAVEFITSFRLFLATVKVGGIYELISTLVVSIFGMHLNLNFVVKAVVKCLTNIIPKGTGLSTFLEAFIKLILKAGGGSH